VFSCLSDCLPLPLFVCVCACVLCCVVLSDITKRLRNMFEQGAMSHAARVSPAQARAKLLEAAAHTEEWSAADVPGEAKLKSWFAAEKQRKKSERTVFAVTEFLQSVRVRVCVCVCVCACVRAFPSLLLSLRMVLYDASTCRWRTTSPSLKSSAAST
jgi:hypothetical protein